MSLLTPTTKCHKGNPLQQITQVSNTSPVFHYLLYLVPPFLPLIMHSWSICSGENSPSFLRLYELETLYPSLCSISYSGGSPYWSKNSPSTLVSCTFSPYSWSYYPETPPSALVPSHPLLGPSAQISRGRCAVPLPDVVGTSLLINFPWTYVLLEFPKDTVPPSSHCPPSHTPFLTPPVHLANLSR